MKRDGDRQEGPPLGYSLALFFGRPFGLRWVPDNHLGVIYRMEMYHRLRGPGFFWISPFVESVNRQVNLGPDYISINIPNLNTRDGMQLEWLKVGLAFAFDPRRLPRHLALEYVKWSQGVVRLIVQDFATRALLAIIPNYFAEQICRGEVFDPIEDLLMDLLIRYLDPLAIRPNLALVLEVAVPKSLQDTFTAVVKREVYTHDLSQFEPFQITEAQRRELYEVLQGIEGIRYLDISDLQARPPLDGADWPPSQQTIRGTSTSLTSSSSEAGIDERPDAGPKSHLPPPASIPTRPESQGKEPSERPSISRKSHLYDD